MYQGSLRKDSKQDTGKNYQACKKVVRFPSVSMNQVSLVVSYYIDLYHIKFIKKGQPAGYWKKLPGLQESSQVSFGKYQLGQVRSIILG